MYVPNMPKGRVWIAQPYGFSGDMTHRLTVSVVRSGIREEIDTGLWDGRRQKGG